VKAAFLRLKPDLFLGLVNFTINFVRWLQTNGKLTGKKSNKSTGILLKWLTPQRERIHLKCSTTFAFS